MNSAYSNTFSASRSQHLSLGPLNLDHASSGPYYSQDFPFGSSHANNILSSAPHSNVFSSTPSQSLHLSSAPALAENFSSAPSQSHLFTQAPSDSIPSPRKFKSSLQEDETLRLLKKCYLEALLTQKPHKHWPVSKDNIVPNQRNHENRIVIDPRSPQGDLNYKKLWEDCQAENRKLSQDIDTVRAQLGMVKHQLEVAAQASALNSVSDTEKSEKRNMEKKLIEIRNELKLFTLSGNVTSQQLERLGQEIEDLKYENLTLSQNVLGLIPGEEKQKQAKDHHSV